VTAGAFSVTVTLPETDVSCTLVAVTVTVAGAGYGVVYSPVDEMVPALRELPEGGVTVHVTLPLVTPEPFTVAINCAVPPTVADAGLGVIVTELTVGVV
jgi:hypothetical protein